MCIPYLFYFYLIHASIVSIFLTLLLLYINIPKLVILNYLDAFELLSKEIYLNLTVLYSFFFQT